MPHASPPPGPPPPPATSFDATYPTPHTLLLTITRPKSLNSLPYAAHWEAAALLAWFDAHPHLRVAVLTGEGDRAFCAGQDLLEQNELAAARASGAQLPPEQMLRHPPEGFCAVSRRGGLGKKPVIAAVNGWAMGGGFEICLGCDLIVAAPRASFALPEAQRGLYAAAGGLSRLVRTVGVPLASEIAVAGRVLSASEAHALKLVNKVSETNESVVDEAVELASSIAEGASPDAVVVTRAGIWAGVEEGGVEVATQKTEGRFGRALREGENIRRGLEAFAGKRRPVWVASRL